MELPSNNGRSVNPWDFKQRKNSNLFHHGVDCEACANYLKQLQKVYGKIQNQNAEVAAISFDSPRKLRDYGEKTGISFLLLSDEEKHISEKFASIDEAREAPFPSLLVTDRFGVLRFQKAAAEANVLPNAKEGVIWLEYMQSECPECSSL